MEQANKPTIVFVTPFVKDVSDNIRQGKPPGGVPSVAYMWTKCLEHGFDVHVFVVDQVRRTWPKETVQLGGVKFHWVRQAFWPAINWLQKRPKLHAFCRPLNFFSQLMLLWRILRSRIKPDIIYSMRFKYTFLSWLWGRLVGAKIVQRHYGTWLYHHWFEQDSWLPRIATLGELLTYYIPTDLLIMTNDGTRGDKVAEWLGVPNERFRFWLNGVNKFLRQPDFDAGAFKQGIGLPPDAPMLLTLGRLVGWKRIDRSIDAMPGILRDFPDARLVIVGGGELRRQLEDRASRRGVSDAVMFAGPVTHDEIKEYLNAADIFIIVHDLTNMCSTLIEAITAGSCVITRDVGTTTDIVMNNENAVVLSPGEADDIAHAATQLLKNPLERRRLGDNAYAYAMKKFQTWDERIEMEVNCLKELIGVTGTK